MQLITALAAGLLLAGIVSSSAHADPCLGISLKIDSAGQDAAMSKTAFGYTITNVGPKACTVEGFPEIQFLDTKGQPVSAIRIKHENQGYFAPGGKPASVEVKPGGQAAFSIEMVSAPVADQPCQNAVEARVTLPHTETPSTFAGSFTSCGEAVSVTPLRPGPSPLQ